jgi:hypothetical protein
VSRAAAVVAAGVLVTLVASVASVALAGGALPRGPAAGSATEAPHPSSVSQAPLAVPATAARWAGAVRPEDPAAVRLPAGTVVPVVPVTSRADGSLAVPDDIRQAGWWRGGARIGDPFGSTLLAGHVDSSTQGLGPFAELLSVRPGAVVVITTRHLTQRFRVTSLRLVPQGTLPQQRWVYAVAGARRLTLVTCAPPYVGADGGYQNLAVVTARPLGRPFPSRHP